jgi:hypothetical protein
MDPEIRESILGHSSKQRLANASWAFVIVVQVTIFGKKDGIELIHTRGDNQRATFHTKRTFAVISE